MKRLNLVLIASLGLFTSTYLHGAETYFVFGVKHDFQMSEQDAPFKDFYVNLGTNQGVKTGSILDVYRTISTADEVNKKVGEKISFKIGRIRVIHAEDSVSVARVQEMRSPKETPIGDIPTIVVGDYVEVGRK